MFDANARYLPKDTRFFAFFYSCSKDSIFYKEGFRTGDAILCTKLEDTHVNPKVEVHFKDDSFTINTRDEKVGDSWLIYAGNEDLTDFVRSDELEAAKRYLKSIGK